MLAVIKQTLPFELVHGAGTLWLLSAPFIWLGAALSKMDTLERYNIQLLVASIVSLAAVCAALGAFAGKSWSRTVLFILSCVAAVYWLWMGSSLWSDGYIWPAAVGVLNLGIACVMPFTERRPVGIPKNDG